jgi:hypothetical protein
MCAIWSKHTGFVEAYFWVQPVLWILDLASMIVLLVFAYLKKNSLAQASCVNTPNLQLCLETFNVWLVFMTIGLCIYKIIGACKLFVHIFLVQYHLHGPQTRGISCLDIARHYLRLTKINHWHSGTGACLRLLSLPSLRENGGRHLKYRSSKSILLATNPAPVYTQMTLLVTVTLHLGYSIQL